MVQNSRSAQRLAATLLGREMVFVDSTGPEIETSAHRINYLILNDRYLHQILFDVVGNDAATRTEYFGPGNESIDVDFDELRKALSRLARAGAGDSETLLEGEATLIHLIRGVQQYEREAKAGINPAEAEALALFAKQLRGKDMPAAKHATPNEIDAQQHIALGGYQWARHARLVLEEMQATLKQINRELGKGDRPPPAPSR